MQVALEPVPPPVEHVVPLAVAFVGFTPDDALAFWSALPLAPALADACACPLALPFPFAVALPLPWPFPATADPAKTVSASASTRLTAAVMRLLIWFSPRI